MSLTQNLHTQTATRPVKAGVYEQAQATVSTLDTVEPGTTVSVTNMQHHNPTLFRKLHAMGLVSGSQVKVVGRAPLGDPISISTLGYILSLRLAEARHVEVSSPNQE